MIHAANLVRIAIDASLHHRLHCIDNCQSNRLLILLKRAETEYVSEWQKAIDIHRHSPRLIPNNCHILDPPFISLPTTFKLELTKYTT